MSDRPPVTHELKVWPPYFGEIYIGRKPFEVRRNDRDFRTLDLLRLREFDPRAQGGLGAYTERECRRMIGYILHGLLDPVLGDMEAAHAGIAPGFVVLGLVSAPSDMGADLATWRDRHGFSVRMAPAGEAAP